MAGEGRGTEGAITLEPVADCDRGSAAKDNAASASGKAEEVEAKEEGPGGSLEEQEEEEGELFWLLFRE